MCICAGGAKVFVHCVYMHMCDGEFGTMVDVMSVVFCKYVLDVHFFGPISGPLAAHA